MVSKDPSATAFTKNHTRIVKGIAVLMLLFHHLFNDYPEYEGHYINYWPFTGDQVTNIALACRACVAVFVFITGYGLAASYAKTFSGGRKETPRELTKFSLTRWWNLMTRYWFIVVLAWVSGQFLGRRPWDVYGPGFMSTVSRAVLDFLGISESFQSGWFNPTWWYMSLAILMIFLAPLANYISRRVGSLTLLAVFWLILGGFKFTATVALSLPSFFFGIVCFEYRLFDKWNDLWGDRRWGIAMKAFLLIAAMAACFAAFLNYNFLGVLEVSLAWLICASVMTFISRVPGLCAVLGVFGKHSDNLFFTHTLLYSYFFLDFYYSFQIPAVILVVLAATTLLLSIAIKAAKSYSGYSRRMDELGAHAVDLLAAPVHKEEAQ